MLYLPKHRGIVEAKRRRIYESGGGAIATPADLLTTNGMWLSASRGHAFASTVASMEDQAGSSSVTFTQAVGSSQPTYIAGPPARISFDGTQDFLQAPSVAKMTPTTSFYWAAWMQDGTTQNRNFWSQWDSSDELWQFARNTTNEYVFTLAESMVTFGTLVFPALPDTGDHFVEVVYNGLLAASNRLKYFVDRGEETSTGGSGTIPSTLQSASPDAYIACFQGVARKGMAFANIYMDLTIPTEGTRDFFYGFEDPTV